MRAARAAVPQDDGAPRLSGWRARDTGRNRVSSSRADCPRQAALHRQGHRDRGPVGARRHGDGLLDVHLKPPRAMGGRGGPPTPSSCSPPGTRPASRARSAWPAAARAWRPRIRWWRPMSASAWRGGGPRRGGGYGLAVVLKVSIPGVDADTTLRLAEAAHQVCPLLEPTRGNIEVMLEAN